jgi:calcineurin-like phosphoesterase family protein
MKVFVISDTHFSHKKALEWRPNFKSVEHMNMYMVAMWNQIVTPGDIVYHCGDFALGKFDKSLLNGNLIILNGSHDDKKGYPYKLYLNYGGFNFVLSHEPLDNFDADFNIHGHLHNKTPFWEGQYRINVSVENIQYQPLNLETIVRNIQRNPNILGSHSA